MGPSQASRRLVLVRRRGKVGELQARELGMVPEAAGGDFSSWREADEADLLVLFHGKQRHCARCFVL